MSDSAESVMGTVLYEFVKTAVTDVYRSLSRSNAITRASADPASVASAYVKSLTQRCQSRRIWKEDTPHAVDQLFVPVTLELPPTRTPHKADIDFLLLGGQQATTTNTVEAFQVIDSSSRLVLLGRPGSGKTTLLKAAVSRYLHAGQRIEIWPFYVSAGQVEGPSANIHAYLARELETYGVSYGKEFLDAIFGGGRCLLIVDGLDEISSRSLLRQSVSSIQEIALRFPRLRIIVSCRSAAYDNWFTEFSEANVPNFDMRQVEQFVWKWFGADQRADDCLREIVSRPEAVDFATSPLLLTLICACFEQIGDFPPNKATLYRDALYGLLGKWDAVRLIRRQPPRLRVSREQEESLFRRLARKSLDSSQDVWSRSEVEDEIRSFIHEFYSHEFSDDAHAPEVLTDIESRHGILADVGAGKVAFAHLAFRDYYAASQIVGESTMGSASWLADEKLVDSQRHGEVIQIVAALLHDATGFVERIARHAFVLDGLHAQTASLVARFDSNSKFDVVSRGLGALCVVFQLRPLALALDMSLGMALRRPVSQVESLLDAIVVRLGLSLLREKQLAARIDRDAERRIQLVLESKELLRLEAIRSLVRSPSANFAKGIALLRELGPIPHGQIMEKVNLDLTASEIHLMQMDNYMFGRELRTVLRRQLLVVDCLNAGAAVNAMARASMLARVLPAGFQMPSVVG